MPRPNHHLGVFTDDMRLGYLLVLGTMPGITRFQARGASVLSVSSNFCRPRSAVISPLSFASRVSLDAIFFLKNKKQLRRNISQLVPDVAAAGLARPLHGHELDDQARPAREVLRALALARLGVVLLPREARLLPAVVDRVDKVLAKAGE